MAEEGGETIRAPNWMRELEAKREKRLKARLGHEAGAGSPCFECKEKCPGLDLHFWRKICKNCRCGKENHDVQDEDLYGWVQLQLLGSKFKKPQRIVLPGKKDEVELEWAPKGSQEAVEKYLNELPPDLLPIKGSSAAQERKQLLQKQIPLHDVDPNLCHALTEEEMRQMEDYINHMKENSVGVGQIMRLRPHKARLISTKFPAQISNSTYLKQLENLSIKHDYENIDAFGRHKLMSSLEAIERKQSNDFACPINAQYAMLLDEAALPLKDKMGPIKTFVDVYGNPIFDVAVFERIKPLNKAEYAMLLDKNSVPILNTHGNPIKNWIDYKPGFPDGLGNRQQPHSALLLDHNHSPLISNGNPINLDLDVYGAPILERGLIEIVNKIKPEFACYLDKTGNIVVDKYGHMIKYGLDQLKPQCEKKYALLLDENRGSIKCKFGNPVIANLDYFGGPVLDDYIIEKLNGQIPHYATLLDKNGGPILDTEQQPLQQAINILKQPIYDKFGQEIRPQFGLLLDKNEVAIKDPIGSPIKVALDAFARPIIDHKIIDKLHCKPEFTMYLDRNGAPILDKYGSPIKNIVTNEPVNAKYAILLDKNQSALKDNNGPIMVNLDATGGPLIDQGTIEKLHGAIPKYVKLLDGDKTPITIEPIGRAPIIDKFGNEIQPKYGLLLDGDEKPFKDQNGSPVLVNFDAIGRPVIHEKYNPQSVLLLDANRAPVLDKFGQKIKEPIDKFVPKIVPKYGVLLDANETPINDLSGAPILTNLDANGDAIIDENIQQQLGRQQPQNVLLLDANRSPVKNKYGEDVIKKLKPQFAVMLDKNKLPIKDGSGAPIITPLDSFGKPIIPDNIDPNFALFLDANKSPISDKFGNNLIEPLDIIDNSTLADSKGNQIIDRYGNPMKIKIDPLGRPILSEKADVNLAGAMLTKKNQPLLDNAGKNIQLTESNGILTVNNRPVYDSNGIIKTNDLNRAVFDKYGNKIDPATGRPILPNYNPQSLPDPEENYVQPTQVNIGPINDENYDAIPQCHKCKKIFEDLALVIQIDRSEALWHSACFKCAGCNQSLADMLYFYDRESDDIYCGRDFAKIRGIPRCNACDELIFVKEYCLAENETYHVKHFCCFECDTTLAGQNYVIENNQPVCISCYETLKANRCNGCDRIIKPDEPGANLNGTHFHASDDCFSCRTCRKPLLGGKFLFRNLRLYCSGPCYNQAQN